MRGWSVWFESRKQEPITKGPLPDFAKAITFKWNAMDTLPKEGDHVLILCPTSAWEDGLAIRDDYFQNGEFERVTAGVMEWHQIAAWVLVRDLLAAKEYPPGGRP